MIQNWVIDSSIALAAVLPDETCPPTEAMDALAQGRAHGPPHLLLEVLNGLVMAERRHRIPRFLRDEIASLVCEWPLTIPGADMRDRMRIVSLADRHGLTIYDAAYLELALRLQTGLATMDKALARAAQAEGVHVLS